MELWDVATFFDRNGGRTGRKRFGLECVGDGVGGRPFSSYANSGDQVVGFLLQVVGRIGAALGIVYEREVCGSVRNIDFVAETGCIGGFQGEGYRIIGNIDLCDGDGRLVGPARSVFLEW